MNRRQFLCYGLGLAGAGLFSLGLAGRLSPKLPGGVAGPPSSSAASSTSSGSTSVTGTQHSSLPDYQDFLRWLHSVSGPYSGRSLNVSLEAEFGAYSTQLIDADFMNASGIRGQYNIKPYALQLQDIVLMSATKSSSYDTYSLDVQNLGVFPNLPVSPYTLAEQYPDLTYANPGTDFKDFDRFAWDRIATYPPDLSGGPGGSSAGHVGVLPFDTPTMVIFYRKDIFQKLGLTPPKTWDEHFANSQAIQKSGLTPFGSASTASTDVSIIYEYLAHLSDFGGSLWQVEGNTIIPTVDTDAALAALEDFVRFEAVSDPGSTTYTFGDIFDSLAHQYAPQALMFDGFNTWLNDPARSNAVGLIGVAKLPAGPKGSFSPYAGSGVGVSRYSKNPEMAWLWIQWAVAKGTQEAKILGRYQNYPTRSSVLEASEVASALQTSSLTVANLVNEIWREKALTTLIGFPQWLAASNIVAIALYTAWTGTVAPKPALANAQTKLEQLGTLTF